MNERRDFIVREIADNCDLPGEHEDDYYETMRFFWDGAESDAADDKLAEGLDQIGDLLAHGKRPWRRYSHDWKVVRGSGNLEPEEWPLVVAVLMKFADLADASTKKGLGRAFDWTNAALTAMDLMKEDNTELAFEDELREWANDVVDRVATSLQPSS